MSRVIETATPITIVLTQFEVGMAANVGFRRQLIASMTGAKPRFREQHPGQLWYSHIAGACAELAVAKHLGAYWDGSINVSTREDIPGWSCDVRFSPRVPKVKPTDTLRIVAVKGSPDDITKYTILGWLHADEAKQDEWRSDNDPPCFFPPENAWRNIATLERDTMASQALRNKGIGEKLP
jgi:hypothetical protein